MKASDAFLFAGILAGFSGWRCQYVLGTCLLAISFVLKVADA